MENDWGTGKKRRTDRKGSEAQALERGANGSSIEGAVSEQAIKKDVCELLARFPDRILFTVTPPKRTKYTSKYMRVGWPDIYGVHLQGEWDLADKMWLRPFFIEVKKPGGTLSLEQHKILEQANAMGAITCVATDVQSVKEALGL